MSQMNAVGIAPDLYAAAFADSRWASPHATDRSPQPARSGGSRRRLVRLAMAAAAAVTVVALATVMPSASSRGTEALQQCMATSCNPASTLDHSIGSDAGLMGAVTAVAPTDPTLQCDTDDRCRIGS